MGVDLRLLVVDGRTGSNAGYSHTMMEFGRWYDVFELLYKKERTIPGFELSGFCSRIPDGSWKGENGYGTIAKTPYGDPLKYVSAAEFLECAAGYKFLSDLTRACVAFVRKLKPDTLIGLYWH